MRGLTPQQQLIAEFDHAAERLNAAIAGLTDAQASKPADDGWSIKDHLSHVTFWHEMRFFEISRIARGGRYGFPPTSESGVEHINNQMVENRRSLPLDQLVADLDFAREMVRQAVISAPENRLDQALFGEMGVSGGGEHELEHAEVVTALRAGT